MKTLFRDFDQVKGQLTAVRRAIVAWTNVIDTLFLVLEFLVLVHMPILGRRIFSYDRSWGGLLLVFLRQE